MLNYAALPAHPLSASKLVIDVCNVSRICMDCKESFGSPAVLQLQHNNVDMALEWLLSNPEEPPEPMSEAAPTASPKPEVEIAQSFPAETNQPEASNSKSQVLFEYPTTLVNFLAEDWV